MHFIVWSSYSDQSLIDFQENHCNDGVDQVTRWSEVTSFRAKVDNKGDTLNLNLFKVNLVRSSLGANSTNANQKWKWKWSKRFGFRSWLHDPLPDSDPCIHDMYGIEIVRWLKIDWFKFNETFQQLKMVLRCMVKSELISFRRDIKLNSEFKLLSMTSTLIRTLLQTKLKIVSAP